ncbi:hypothetical protein PoB_003587600 [Plakobranchus ocellatus]|uniref:Uncharacterized protein n=1 Tax=Plakobranchus ocellatus TaxID=259542 RepID=A0AAV4ADU8_9GAST|nr:hypothetical protein PoB_003587600 [Plakobranchus ocellatus]
MYGANKINVVDWGTKRFENLLTLLQPNTSQRPLFSRLPARPRLSLRASMLWKEGTTAREDGWCQLGMFVLQAKFLLWAMPFFQLRMHTRPFHEFEWRTNHAITLSLERAMTCFWSVLTTSAPWQTALGVQRSDCGHNSHLQAGVIERGSMVVTDSLEIRDG